MNNVYNFIRYMSMLQTEASAELVVQKIEICFVGKITKQRCLICNNIT